MVCAPLLRPSSHTPTTVIDGKIYVFGGGGDNFKSLSSSAVYDPAADRWSPIADMPTARSGTVGCTVSGKAYVIGGGFKQPDGMFRFLKDVEIYDPRIDTWSRGPSMSQPHDYPGGVLHDGYIYILGGHHPDATTSGPKTDPGFDFCERLNLATSEWETLPPLPTPRFALSGIAREGKILALGGVAFRPEGFDNFTIIEEYDPATNRWFKSNELALPWPAAGQSNCLHNGALYTFGGYSGDGIHDGCAVFDPNTKAWLRLPPMPAPRAATGIAVIGNSIYLTGGWADDGRSPMDSLFRFDIDG